MANKYYQLDKEDICFGLPYEQILPIGMSIINFAEPQEEVEVVWSTRYVKGVFGISPAHYFGSEMSSIIAAIGEGKCRAKCLDKDDFEELGFSPIAGDLFKGVKNIYRKDDLVVVHFTKTQTIMSFTSDPRRAELNAKNPFRNDDNHVVSFSVKSKFELERFLKKLNGK